jgi:hypothetical protein
LFGCFFVSRFSPIITNQSKISCSPLSSFKFFVDLKKKMYLVYVGNIANDVSNDDLRKEFGVHADVKDIQRNFRSSSAMIKYDSLEDAQGAVERYNGLELNGNKVVVENPRPVKPTKGNKPPIRYDLRVLVKGLKPTVSWQDLKDWARESMNGAEVNYSNVFDFDGVHCGLVEYKVNKNINQVILSSSIGLRFD